MTDRRKQFPSILTGLLLLSILLSCKGSDSLSIGANNAAIWARSTIAGASSSVFSGIAKDSSGNLYSVGYQTGTSTYTYGSGVSATGANSGLNATIVKYDSAGNAVWAKSTTVAPNNSSFYSVATDAGGNVYAAGYQTGNSSFSYASGISATGAASGVGNAVLVKYDSNGNAIWARSTTTAPNQSVFYGVAVDTSGNIYVAGSQAQNGTFNYSAGVSVAGVETVNTNAVIVKYDSTGAAVWARSTTAGAGQTVFNALAVDSSGNLYAAGQQFAGGSVNYAAGVSVTGAYNGGGYNSNVLLVKYDSAGNAVWARSTIGGSTYSSYGAVAVDASGNIFAAGYQTTNNTFSYAAGVTVTAAIASDNNALLVKYDASGNAVWARSTVSGTTPSSFSGITTDAAGNIFVVGGTNSSGNLGFGNNAALSSISTAGIILVKYTSNGTAERAIGLVSAPGYSSFRAALADSSGNVYAVGNQSGNGAFDYGGATASASYGGGQNASIVKYHP